MVSRHRGKAADVVGFSLRPRTRSQFCWRGEQRGRFVDPTVGKGRKVDGRKKGWNVLSVNEGQNYMVG